jgi:outer membrane protein OmpA-like peptidoglycan-associated protein
MNIYVIILFLLVSGTIIAQFDPPTYSVNRLKVNSKEGDFGTTFYKKNKIVFSSSRNMGLSYTKWDGNDQSFLDLYIGDVVENGEIENVKRFSSKVNSKYHDAMVSFSPDFKQVYFTSNHYERHGLKSTGLNIFKASVSENDHWENIVNLPFNSDDYDTGHPSLSSDGKKLYFISNMPGGYGDTDIYVVSISNGHYGVPKNLGPTVNSKYKEYTPFVDGDIIYFSSNRPKGFGELDIYMNKLDESIQEPINLGKPINSKGDDLSFIIDNRTQKGYLSSNRSGGKGDDDIYSFIQVTVNPICDQTIEGVVKDKITGLPIVNAYVILYNSNGDEIKRMKTFNDGKYLFRLKCNETYRLSSGKNGFFENIRSINIDNENGFENKVTLLLNEKKFTSVIGKITLNIEPIEFEFNKVKILKKSKINLAKVVILMDKYPDMIIEIDSHTDSRGSDGYNLWLSSERAAETIKYLVSIGADSKRISGKGFGENKLLNNCSNDVKCTEEEHQLNRRTEFVIIKM